MEKTFVIGWQTKDSGRRGRGKALLTRAEAEAMAAELNRDYPSVEHYVIDVAAEHSAHPELVEQAA